MLSLQSNDMQPKVMESNVIRPNAIHTNVIHPIPLACPIKVAATVVCNNCLMKVGGKGIVKAEPDEASVVLGVVTENMQLENAQSENTQKMSNVIDSLTKLGIRREDIRTQSYQIQPQYDYINGEQVFRGYRVVHEVKVEISNINMVGVIIDEAVRAGANTVSDISFSVSNPQIYYEMALNQALSDAVAKAISIGTKMSVYVNPIPLKITEITAPGTAPIPYMLLQAAGATTPIQPGLIEITAILEVEFAYSCNRNY